MKFRQLIFMCAMQMICCDYLLADLKDFVGEIPAVRLMNHFGISVERGVLGRTDIYRPGSYWTLGAAVDKSLDLGTNPDQTIAVLVSFKHLEGRMLNISPFNTFVMGDLPICNRSGAIHILYQKSVLEPAAWNKCTNVTLIQVASETPIENAVDKFIKSAFSEYFIAYSKHPTWHGPVADIAFSKFLGADINAPYYFKGFLRPQMSFGWNDSPLVSGIFQHYLELEDFSQSDLGFSDGDPFYYRSYKYFYDFLDSNRSWLERSAKSLALKLRDAVEKRFEQKNVNLGLKLDKADNAKLYTKMASYVQLLSQVISEKLFPRTFLDVESRAIKLYQNYI